MALISDGLSHQIRLTGLPLRARYYTISTGSVWDDEATYSQSGTDFYTSGTVHKIDATRGSEDQILMEQGRIAYDDSKFFVSGNFQTSSGTRVFTLAVSGAAGVEKVYREIIAGIMPSYAGNAIYKKIYCRWIPTGSLF